MLLQESVWLGVRKPSNARETFALTYSNAHKLRSNAGASMLTQNIGRIA